MACNKCANIRGEGVRSCPFSLPIPEACENVGSAIERMAITEDDENLKKANLLVYAYHKECKECSYNDKVLEEYKKVDCNFGDTAEGKKSTSFTGSPLYPQTFHGLGLDGIMGYPLGYYADNNESRNLFIGLFSLLGSAPIEEIIKLADKYDECGEKESSDIIDGLLQRLDKIKQDYRETFEKIEKYILENRDNFENDRADTGFLVRLYDERLSPRQTNR